MTMTVRMILRHFPSACIFVVASAVVKLGERTAWATHRLSLVAFYEWPITLNTNYDNDCPRGLCADFIRLVAQIHRMLVH